MTDKPIGPFPNLLAVADGMGGHKADLRQIYGEGIAGKLEDTPLDKPEEILRNVGIANHKLIEAALVTS